MRVLTKSQGEWGRYIPHLFLNHMLCIHQRLTDPQNSVKKGAEDFS